MENEREPIWNRIRWWGVYRVPADGRPCGSWIFTKTAWMPPVCAILFGAYVGPSSFVGSESYGIKMGMLAAAMLSVPWLFSIAFVYSIWQEGVRDKYPLTQYEAYLAAGYTNIYQVPSFAEWARLHDLRWGEVISFNYESGQIYPGRAAVDHLRAKQGLPQVEGPHVIANAYLTNNSPMYHNMRLEYAVRFGGVGYIEPPKYYGIAPQPSIPK